MGRVARSRMAVAIVAAISVLFGVPAGAHAAPGTVSVVPNPTATGSGTTVGELAGVSCVNASNCFAVGGRLVEHWNGKRWTVMTIDGSMAGVSCVNASNCFAVGGTLVDHWNGKQWTIMASPTIDGSLAGVSCVNASTCFAVGIAYSFEAEKTLVERWDGKRWAVMASPNGSGDAVNASWLTGVSCASASSCFAVGSYYFIPDAITSLVEHWNGKAWTIMDPSASYLNGVSCVSASNCYAVGDSFFPPSQSQNTVVAHWNGQAWTGVATPDPPRQNPLAPTFGDLTGVSCVNASNCYLVGYYNYGSGENMPLVEHWNGTAWTIMANPSGVTVGELAGVSCVHRRAVRARASNCFAVGSANGMTLIEHLRT